MPRLFKLMIAESNSLRSFVMKGIWWLNYFLAPSCSLIWISPTLSKVYSKLQHKNISPKLCTTSLWPSLLSTRWKELKFLSECFNKMNLGRQQWLDAEKLEKNYYRRSFGVLTLNYVMPKERCIALEWKTLLH